MQTLSKRLDLVASLVKKGSTIADVGTDHGYIPVFLCKTGIIKGAVACDINIGPLSSCEALVLQEGLSDYIKVRLSNGLDNVKSQEFDTLIIAGMGGELIKDILSRCTYVKEKHIILNPMTHCEIVRKYLYDNGFEIINDIIVEDSKHYYSVLDAKYTGNIVPKNRTDYYLGEIKDFSCKGYFAHLLNYLKNKEKSGEDYSDVITALEEIL